MSNLNLLQIDERLFHIESHLQKIQTSLKPILSFEEAHAYLNIAPSYLYKLTSSKSIRYFKPLGKLNYFLREDLDAFLLQNPSEALPKEQQTVNNWVK